MKRWKSNFLENNRNEKDGKAVFAEESVLFEAKAESAYDEVKHLKIRKGVVDSV